MLPPLGVSLVNTRVSLGRIWRSACTSLRCIKMANPSVRILDRMLDRMSVRENTRLHFFRHWCDVTEEALWNRRHAPRIDVACVDKLIVNDSGYLFVT